MVKGITKQVVVLRAPEPGLFEQAIFIVRSSADGVTQEELLRQARAAAGRCAASGHPASPRRRELFIRLTCLLAGALAVALAWGLTALL